MDGVTLYRQKIKCVKSLTKIWIKYKKKAMFRFKKVNN